MSRKIDNNKYLGYLLLSLKVPELNQICKDHSIRGFSKWKKDEKIKNILNSLSDEEIAEVIRKKEPEVIAAGIDLAIKKIRGEDREQIESIVPINEDLHEIEANFDIFGNKTGIEMAIREDNIDDPERLCDCRVGSEGGLCNHFWVGFIASLKWGYFKLSDWTLTYLPEDFEERIKTIKISKGSGGVAKQSAIVDESSSDFQLAGFTDQSITIYEGEIEKVAQKEQVFQEISTIYYLITLKNVKMGPRVQRKSDFKEEDIRNLDSVTIRISEKLQDENSFSEGDKVSTNGKLVRDNFLRIYIVKNIRKVTRI